MSMKANLVSEVGLWITMIMSDSHTPFASSKGFPLTCLWRTQSWAFSSGAWRWRLRDDARPPGERISRNTGGKGWSRQIQLATCEDCSAQPNGSKERLPCSLAPTSGPVWGLSSVCLQPPCLRPRDCARVDQHFDHTSVFRTLGDIRFLAKVRYSTD